MIELILSDNPDKILVLDEGVKQVIVVRKDLKMRKGKLAAQVAHASMKVISDKLAKYVGTSDEVTGEPIPEPGRIEYLLFDVSQELQEWIDGSFTKIVVGVDSEEELLALYHAAEERGILCSLVTDKGLTEFHGVPTNTCVAIGPDRVAVIDDLTNDLTLL